MHFRIENCTMNSVYRGLDSCARLMRTHKAETGRKIRWKGGVFYRPLNQMRLSIHPPCGFGWIDGHVTIRNQGLCSND